MVAVPRDAEREKFLEFSDSLLERKGFMYAQFPKAAGMKVASLTDLKGLTVGTVKGASYGADFEAAVSAGGIRLDGSADLESAFRKLAEGRVDVVLAVNLAAAEILRLPEFSGKFATIGLPYQSTPLAIGIGRSSPALDQLPRINEAIAAMKADGSLKKILAKYGL
jgi:polar amino acid transport system substrate-binding protein